MTRSAAFVAIVVLAFMPFGGGTVMEFKQLSPIIFVNEIEPCLPFWEERLGFARVAEVQHGDKLGFAMLQRENVSVMYQSYASAEADVPAVVDRQVRPGISLYLSIADFVELKQRLEGIEVVVAERKTFYGATETFVRAPCGTVVGFAEIED